MRFDNIRDDVIVAEHRKCRVEAARNTPLNLAALPGDSVVDDF